MNYKDLFHKALILISSPARAWEEISLEENEQMVYTAFVYPMIGLCGISVFIGALFSHGWDGPASFQYAMTQCCAVAVSLFGGYFLAAYLMQKISKRMLKFVLEKERAHQLAGYALVTTFLLKIIIGILPDFKIIALLLQFYMVFIVWEGSRVLLQLEEEKRLHFTLTSTALLLLCPWFIEWLFGELTYMLN